MFNKQLALQRIRMVKILLIPRLERELREDPIVHIERKQRRPELPCQLPRQRRLAPPRTPRAPHHNRPLRKVYLLSLLLQSHPKAVAAATCGTSAFTSDVNCPSP